MRDSHFRPKGRRCLGFLRLPSARGCSPTRLLRSSRNFHTIFFVHFNWHHHNKSFESFFSAIYDYPQLVFAHSFCIFFLLACVQFAKCCMWTLYSAEHDPGWPERADWPDAPSRVSLGRASQSAATPLAFSSWVMHTRRATTPLAFNAGYASRADDERGECVGPWRVSRRSRAMPSTLGKFSGADLDYGRNYDTQCTRAIFHNASSARKEEGNFLYSYRESGRSRVALNAPREDLFVPPFISRLLAVHYNLRKKW